MSLSFYSAESLNDLDGQVSFLKKLVSVNSATPNIQGVQLVQSMLESTLSKMNFQTTLIRHPERKYADLLVGDKPAPREDAITVTVVCHADTVFDSKDSLKAVHEDSLMIGPGVADNKGGAIVALSGLNRYLERHSQNVHLRFVSSPNEEIGSHGFTETFKELGLESKIVLGFEPATEKGNIIHCRSGNRWYRIQSKGIEAHAGRASGEEINAAHELLFKIQKIIDLKKDYNDLKVNVAKLSGGKDRYNIVCGNAEAMVDIRFATFSTRDEVHERIQKIVNTPYVSTKDGKPSESSWLLEDDCPPLQKNENPQLAKTYQKIIEEIEENSVELQTVGGASDVNHFNHPQNQALCGLGPIAGKIHTGKEYIVTSSLSTRADALCEFLATLS